MSAMLWWLEQNMVSVAILACAVALLCRLCRFRPAVQHALWLVVLIKLLMPPLVAWPWAVPKFMSPVQAEDVRGEDPPAVEWTPALAPSNELMVRLDALAAQATPAPPDEISSDGPVVSGARPGSPWWQASWVAPAALSLWLGATGVMAIVQLLRVLRFRRLLLQGKRAPRCLRRDVDDLAAKLRVPSPATRLVRRIRSPFVWGLGRAQLLWPAALMDSLPTPCRRSVIAHELAHLRRRDHWVSWLQVLAECLWWWNPLFWYVRRQLRQNAELACDAWVIGTLPEDRRAYAEALIEVTQHVSQTAAPVPALGMNGGARQIFERRLTMIMRDRVPCRVPRAGLAAIGLLALLALPGWSQVDVQLEKKEDVAGTKRLETINKNVLTTMDDRMDELKGVQLKLLDDVVLSNAEVALQALDGSGGPDVRSAKDAEREKCLQALEQQIEALLKEVRALRSGNGSSVRRLSVTTPLALQKDLAVPLRIRTAERLDVLVDFSRADANTVSLVRTSYNLPHAKAEPLAAFLREHVKAKVMETKVDGDSLTVTTTPETQKAVGGLIALIQGKQVARSDAKQIEEDLLRLKMYDQRLKELAEKQRQSKKP